MRQLTREVSGNYARSLHRDHEGEWEFDLTWKPVESFPVRFGWLRAIRQGHARLQAGLSVPAPVLVLSSDRSSAPAEMSEDVFSTDIVLDVRQIRRWASAVGPHVTYVAVPGAVHEEDLAAGPPDHGSRGHDLGASHAASLTPPQPGARERDDACQTLDRRHPGVVRDLCWWRWCAWPWSWSSWPACGGGGPCG